jgi:hypothetical protein
MYLYTDVDTHIYCIWISKTQTQLKLNTSNDVWEWGYFLEKLFMRTLCHLSTYAVHSLWNAQTIHLSKSSSVPFFPKFL